MKGYTKTSFTKILVSIGTILLVLLLANCSGTSSGDAASGVENYLDALIKKDAALLVNYACTAFETEANTEMDSLAAVTVSLKDMSCKIAGQDGDTTLVACSGSLVANYDGEDLEINLADRTYEVVHEGGEWRVCGYR